MLLFVIKKKMNTELCFIYPLLFTVQIRVKLQATYEILIFLPLSESVNGLFVINLNFCNPENVPKPLILQFISKFETILNG